MASPAVAFQARGAVSIGTTARYLPPAPIVRDHRVETAAWSRDRRGYEPVPVYAQPRPQPVDDCDNVAGGYYRGPIGRMPIAGHASIALTAPTRIDSGQEIIPVGTDRGVFTQLTLRATTGATFIRDITVDMGNGDVQCIPVNQWIDARTPARSFDVDGRRGRAIVQLTVNGQSNFGSRYTITSDR
jgi:hypothetical protein